MRTGQFGLMATAAALVFAMPLATAAQQAPSSGTTQPPTERMERGPGPSDTGAVPGAPTTMPPTTMPSTQALSAPDIASAINSDDLIGKKVKNSSNETIGEIDALLVSKDTRVVGVVLDVGGFLGIGGRKVVVPMNQLSVAGSNDVRMPNASKEQLQKAPAYEKPKT